MESVDVGFWVVDDWWFDVEHASKYMMIRSHSFDRYFRVSMDDNDLMVPPLFKIAVTARYKL